MKSKISKQEQEDILLFQSAVGQIERLQHDKIHPIMQHVLPKPLPLFKHHHPQKKTLNSFSEDYEPQSVGNEESLEFRRSGIQERLFSRLRQGRIHIEAELDLHGMTSSIAHQALAQFIDDCTHYHVRCARIIHGKGWGSKNHKPVLKSKLNGWLQQSESVLAFCSATIEDGGTGAVYVLLRRQKSF